jgi:hypothetical protein
MSSHSSLAMLGLTSRDFQIPQSLILQLSNAPTPIFFTSYTLDALPQLNGSVSYITTSEVLERVRFYLLVYASFIESASTGLEEEKNEAEEVLINR